MSASLNPGSAHLLGELLVLQFLDLERHNCETQL